MNASPDVANGIFADVVGGDDTLGMGTAAAPVKTLAAAIALATAQGRPSIYLTAGTYASPGTGDVWHRDCNSKVTDVPMAPGTYPIVAKAGLGKNKSGQFIVGGLGLIFGDAMFEGKSGTLKLERFDAEGAKGSFTIDGNEILTGSRPLHIEGTFDIPCRKGLLQSACKSDKAEPPR